MQPFPHELLAHFEAHHGIASTSTLVGVGLSVRNIRSMVESGNLRPVLKGVYHMPAAPLDEMARCVAVCAAHHDAAVSGPTAGRIWAFRRLPRDHRVHVIVPPESQPTIAPWVVPYRTAAIHGVDLIRRPDGITLTSRAPTSLDLTRYVNSTDLRSVIEQAMHDGVLTADDLRRCGVDWMSRGRPWVRRFLETLDARVIGGPAESHGESVLGDALQRAGVYGLKRQYKVDLPGYGPARFDLAVPRCRLAIEIDLFPTHRESAGRTRDQWRDRSAAELEWSVERIVDTDFGTRLDATVRRLVEIVSRFDAMSLRVG